MSKLQQMKRLPELSLVARTNAPIKLAVRLWRQMLPVLGNESMAKQTAAMIGDELKAKARKTEGTFAKDERGNPDFSRQPEYILPLAKIHEEAARHYELAGKNMEAAEERGTAARYYRTMFAYPSISLHREHAIVTAIEFNDRMKNENSRKVTR